MSLRRVCEMCGLKVILGSKVTPKYFGLLIQDMC
jgi:hypothetical protein